MPRRVSLPGANELFRSTDDEHQAAHVEQAPQGAAARAGSGTARRTKPVVPPFEEAVAPQTRRAVARKRAARSAGRDADAGSQGADDVQAADTAQRSPAESTTVPDPAAATAAAAGPQTGQDTRPASGRVRHDEKITVYVSSDELMALERGRLALRGEFGLAVDRGRIVRESIALAMADLAERGAGSDLVRRLDGQ